MRSGFDRPISLRDHSESGVQPSQRRDFAGRPGFVTQQDIPVFHRQNAGPRDDFVVRATDRLDEQAIVGLAGNKSGPMFAAD